MQTFTPQEEGACVETEMSGEQHLPSCRTTNLNSPILKGMQSLNARSESIVKIMGRLEKIVGWSHTLNARLGIKMESLQTIGGKRQTIMGKPLKITVCQTEIMGWIAEMSGTPQEIGAKLQ